MLTSNAIAMHAAGAQFEPITIERRAPGPHDVVVDIAYCGICHTDIHHCCNQSGKTTFPIVPGHEIAGRVSAVGSAVTRFKVGDRAGIGTLVDACGACDHCHAGREQYCAGRVLTYDAIGSDGKVTHGGYSQRIVVNERFVVHIPDGIPLENAAPMLCAGITMYSPLRHHAAGPGKRVAIVGLGGLGHLGLQIAKAMGAEVSVLDISEDKRADALRLGADDFRLANDPQTFCDLDSAFDLILATVALDTNAWLSLLAFDGTLVHTVSGATSDVAHKSLADNRRTLAATRTGGLAETQEMMDFCAAHGIGAQIEVIGAGEVDHAFARVIAGDVKFRFVVDMSTAADGLDSKLHA